MELATRGPTKKRGGEPRARAAAHAQDARHFNAPNESKKKVPAILRCQTWNVWPEQTVIEHSPFTIEYGGPFPVMARLAILSYLNRTKPENFQQETTALGPLVWDGAVAGLYLVRDTILKAPEDTVEVAFEYRNAQGERLIFASTSSSLVSFHVCLRRSEASCISDHVASQPTARRLPYAVGTATASKGHQRRRLNELTVLLAVHRRVVLTKETLDRTMLGIAKGLVDPQHGEKLRVALELYAAHFIERQVRVRFLLLVMAMESLASATRKHQAAIRLLERWQQELKAEMSGCNPSSDDFQSLEALSRELNFRAEDSIRSQVP